MNEVIKRFAELVEGFENGTIKYLKNSKSRANILKVSMVNGEIVIETSLLEMYVDSNVIQFLKIEGEDVSLKIS